MIYLLYYSAYRVGKDFERDFEVILVLFGTIMGSCLNDFGGHIGMMLLLLFILFQYTFQIMRSLCQEECEADVSNILRSRCQNQCEAYVKKNAKPMSRHSKSSQNLFKFYLSLN